MANVFYVITLFSLAFGRYDMNEIEDAYSAYLQQQLLYNQEWANYIQNWNDWYWQNMLQQQYAAANAAYDYADYADYADYTDSDDKEQDVGASEEGGDEQNFGISESVGCIFLPCQIKRSVSLFRI